MWTVKKENKEKKKLILRNIEGESKEEKFKKKKNTFDYIDPFNTK